MSPLSRKVLLIFLSGIAFGYARTPSRQWKILEDAQRGWRWINNEALKKEIRKLYRSKFVEKKENADGSITITLTDKGKLKALTYHFEKMKIAKQEWDGKWRIVIFDIPEKLRRGRDALRDKLKEIGFQELQKSAFVFPCECRNEVEFIIEFFDLRKYVRFGILESIDNELHLKKNFGLI